MTRSFKSNFFDRLEDRCVPTTGLATVSFAAGGTQVGAQVSYLDRYLNSVGYTNAEDGKLLMLRAMQTWASVTNINIGLVSDSGAAFGSDGLSQQDPRFGDIRIGAVKLAETTVATTIPVVPGTGTWAGDILLNANMNIATRSADFDLATVMIHEAGHAFGLCHQSSATASVMHETYTNRARSLTEFDIASIQALYGTRAADAFEGTLGNNSAGKATILGSGNALAVDADIGAGDVDVFRFKTTAAATYNIDLKAKGLSLLVGKVDLAIARGTTLVQSATASSALNNDIHMTASLAANTEYLVRVTGQGAGFNVGAYQLNITRAGTQAATQSAPIALAWEQLSRTSSHNVLMSGSFSLNETQLVMMQIQSPSRTLGQLTVEVMDANNDVVFQGQLGSNNQDQFNMFLEAGTYTVVVCSDSSADAMYYDAWYDLMNTDIDPFDVVDGGRPITDSSGTPTNTTTTTSRTTVVTDSIWI